MSDTDLKVVIKAKELMKHTYVLTSNPNRYPKKYRHSLVDRLQLKSIDKYKRIRNSYNPVRNSLIFKFKQWLKTWR